jgi:hypothetical protein
MTSFNKTLDFPSMRQERFGNDVQAKEQKESFDVEMKLLSLYGQYLNEKKDLAKCVTFQLSKNTPVHRWFQYTQGFSPQIVEFYLNEWGAKAGDILLDPFVGCGTSLVVAQKEGLNSFGWDLSPLAVFLASVKTTTVDCRRVSLLLNQFRAFVSSNNGSEFEILVPEQMKAHFQKVFPTRILNQIACFQHWYKTQEGNNELRFLLCAAMSSLEEVSYIRKHGSHYRFMNTDNTGVQRKLCFEKLNFYESFSKRVSIQIQDYLAFASTDPSQLVLADARCHKLPKGVHADWVITSPPYLNRNNYIAQSKTEMFFASLLNSFDEYKELTRKTLRSHVEARPSYSKREPNVLIQKITETIKKRGESYRGVSDMIEGYFEDMWVVLGNLVDATRSKSRVAIVIGCSRWSGVIVPTDLLIANQAESSGYYKINRIDVVRYKGNAPQQMAKWGRYPVRESVVILDRV